ncbi:hypothetical protein B0T16DRAFT_399049 [Cercophora newfieldiana]|uniref:RRM domain-containing protein n=1 Tax=Cercophora newfieldiana TaxID=92897 RepID=A0AA39YRC7_9PEZI|nr:hypothetical protein B0T16DRAFT_399049 [Cercophora newfieldiana]
MASDEHSVVLGHSDSFAGPYYILIGNLPVLTSWQNIKDFIRSQFGRKLEIYVRTYNPPRDQGWIRVLGFNTFKQVTSILKKFPFRGRQIITTNPGYNEDGYGSVLIRSPLEADRILSIYATPLAAFNLPLNLPLLPQSPPRVADQNPRYPPGPSLSPGSGIPCQILPDGSIVSHITVYHPVLSLPYHMQPMFNRQMPPQAQPPPPLGPCPPPRTRPSYRPPDYRPNLSPERSFIAGGNRPSAPTSPIQAIPQPQPSPPLQHYASDEDERQILVNLPRVASPTPDKREDIIYAALASPGLLERVDNFPDYAVATFITVQAAKLAVEDLSPLGSILVKPPGETRNVEVEGEAKLSSPTSPSLPTLAATSSPSCQMQEQQQQPRRMTTAVVVNGSITPPDSPPPVGSEATNAAANVSLPSLLSQASATSPPVLGRPGVLVVNGSTPLANVASNR